MEPNAAAKSIDGGKLDDMEVTRVANSSLLREYFALNKVLAYLETEAAEVKKQGNRRNR